MGRWIAGGGPLDWWWRNAGVSAGAGGNLVEPATQIRAILAIKRRRHAEHGVAGAGGDGGAAARGGTVFAGRIAVVASIAGLVAVPGSAAYCAAKAAADAWTVATAPAARAQGVVLTSVCPGYIRTAMTAGNQFPMPGLMDADRRRRIILRGVAAGRVRIAFPWWIGGGGGSANLLPPGGWRR